MATIRKRGPFQWEAQIRRKGYPPQSKTFNTKGQADAWAAMIESEMARGVWISRSESEATTLQEALDRYENEILPGKKGAEPERSVLRSWRSLKLAKRGLASIRSTDIAAERDSWLKLYKPATVLRRLAVLSHLFSIARKESGMESLSNPVELVRKPQPNNARTRRIADADALTIEVSEERGQERGSEEGELERIVAATGSALLPSIIWLAVETAMRRGEIIDLRWEHIDLKRRVAHLPATKNGSARDVPLSTKAVATLQVLRDKRAVMDARLIGRVFSIRSDAVTRAFERAVVRARELYIEECHNGNHQPHNNFLTDLRFHDLRHEATSRLASVFPMHELTKITGHKDPRMLMRYYHPRAEELAKRLA
ncbi:site-specific integrase [Cupriavidus plantarum]|uniref:Integrase n=1 Tax=Cupriavidus plantarum TaxID=942865 RepID=A0A316EJF7_9BURK|nr:site-specific integrase [Cupriavidus plantarum]PWK31907.1 integrase [Cupriavidus plantarum]